MVSVRRSSNSHPYRGGVIARVARIRRRRRYRAYEQRLRWVEQMRSTPTVREMMEERRP